LWLGLWVNPIDLKGRVGMDAEVRDTTGRYFSYNLGPYAADNLVQNINSGDELALETQWKKYVKVQAPGGEYVTHPGLVDRRRKEWDLWSKNIL
jgi:GH24 family phage-related lysozyme (muramidase)